MSKMRVMSKLRSPRAGFAAAGRVMLGVSVAAASVVTVQAAGGSSGEGQAAMVVETGAAESVLGELPGLSVLDPGGLLPGDVGGGELPVDLPLDGNLPIGDLPIGDLPIGNLPVGNLPTIPTVPTVPTVPTIPTVPTTPTVPTIPTIPTVPTVPTTPTNPPGTPACLTNLLNQLRNSPTSLPPSFASDLAACLGSVTPPTNGGNPLNLSQCISAVMGLATQAMTSAMSGGMPNIDLSAISACIPIDLSDCISSVVGSGGNPTAVTSACVPFNLSACLASITGAVGRVTPGTGLPQLNLSACMPNLGSGGSNSPVGASSTGSTSAGSNSSAWR